MFDKLKEVENRYEEIDRKLQDPAVFGNPKELTRLSKEHAELREIVEIYRAYRRLDDQIRDNRELLEDPDSEIREMARSEIAELSVRRDELKEQLKLLLLPKDAYDEKNILLEIRQGTGGEEAALFAADLFRMYFRYAERMGWKLEVLSQNQTGIGGFKEIISSIEGKNVYSRLKYESGVHRVQRVPETEAQGRIHTSAVTVAVLPEADNVEVDLDEKDLRIDVFRSSGPGGQSVNTTDSAVRVTHIPSGITVSCQDEKSQHKNKAKALKILRARLLDRYLAEQQKERARMRKSQVGSGDRSERIRTYNFPQGRVTDHRINLSLYKLEMILDGDIQELITAITTHFQAEALREHAEKGTEL